MKLVKYVLILVMGVSMASCSDILNGGDEDDDPIINPPPPPPPSRPLAVLDFDSRVV